MKTLTRLSWICAFAGIPIAITLGVAFLIDRGYYFVSLVVIVLAMLPFAVSFEGRRPQAREVVVLAVMIAIAVVGRAAFFMLPQFKPSAAIVIITGVSLGRESGFIAGAMTGFVSNFIFGQGPWTPWQMFAFGLIGFLSGCLFNGRVKPLLAICAFGGLSTFLLYGLIMDTASLMMFSSELSVPAALAMYASGVPFNIIHGVASVFFLLLLATVMTEKLDRIKCKFGLFRPKQK